MKEIQAIVNAYKTIDLSANSASLATVVRVEGSSYRRSGARMLVLDNGIYLGGISGGCLEGDALRRAQKAIVQNKPSIITYDTTQDDGNQIGVGLGCNGIIDVLFTPLHNEDEYNPVKILNALPTKRVPSIVVSITGCSEQMNVLGKALLYENDEQFLQSFSVKEIAHNILADIQQCLQDRSSKTIAYTHGDEAIVVFIEIILPVMHLFVYGGNYDIYPLVRVARELGWNVTVVTNINKADKSLFSTATRVLHNKGEDQLIVDPYTAIVLMTHDYKTDYSLFQKALLTEAGYIGLLGPRKRGQKMFEELAQEGNPVPEKDRQRVFAPSGLDIGANTPEEIALSIVAEIQSHFAGRRGGSLRLREVAIHENENKPAIEKHRMMETKRSSL